MKEYIIEGIRFIGTLIKEELQNDINMICRDYQLKNGSAYEVENGNETTVIFTLKKD